MPWLQGDQFDAVMNYPFTNGAIEYFAKDEMVAEDFAHSISEVIHMYSDHVNEFAFNLLDSHDTSRILTLADGSLEKDKLLYLLLISLIGITFYYYVLDICM